MHTDTDPVQLHLRRQLWFALLVVLLAGAWATIVLGAPDSAAAQTMTRAMRLLPVALAIVSAALLRAARAHLHREAVHQLLSDELRQYSLQRAWRNAGVAMLVAQPVLLLGVSLLPVAQPAALQACITIVTGLVSMLGSVLYFDR